MALDMSNAPWSLSRQGPLGLTGASNYWLDVRAAAWKGGGKKAAASAVDDGGGGGTGTSLKPRLTAKDLIMDDPVAAAVARSRGGGGAGAGIGAGACCTGGGAITGTGAGIGGALSKPGA